MGPNDTELTRVYTRRPKQPVADSTLATNEDFEVVAEVEAGSAVFSAGAQYKVNIVIRDLSANDNIPHAPATGIAGTLSIAPWDTQAKRLVFTVKAAALTTRVDHLCEIYAYLQEGLSNPDASFLVSEPFFLQKP